MGHPTYGYLNVRTGDVVDVSSNEQEPFFTRAVERAMLADGACALKLSNLQCDRKKIRVFQDKI